MVHHHHHQPSPSKQTNVFSSSSSFLQMALKFLSLSNRYEFFFSHSFECFVVSSPIHPSTTNKYIIIKKQENGHDILNSPPSRFCLVVVFCSLDHRDDHKHRDGALSETLHHADGYHADDDDGCDLLYCLCPPCLSGLVFVVVVCFAVAASFHLHRHHRQANVQTHHQARLWFSVLFVCSSWPQSFSCSTWLGQIPPLGF